MSTTATLPQIGLCPTCEQDTRVRTNGTTAKHKTHDGQTCPGSGQNAAPLPMTFRRWLSTQKNRRDGDGCNYPLRTIARFAEQRYADDEWTTAENLADVMGLAGIDPETHIVCYLAKAAETYAALTDTTSRRTTEDQTTQ